MTSKQYNDLLRQLGLSQQAAARLLRVAGRTSQRYALDEARIPWSIGKLLRLVRDGRISLEDLRD